MEPAATADPAPAVTGFRLRVPRGTCLWRIARRVYGAGTRWNDIESVNPDAVRPGDHMIREGTELWIPCTPETDPGCSPEAF